MSFTAFGSSCQLLTNIRHVSVLTFLIFIIFGRNSSSMIAQESLVMLSEHGNNWFTPVERLQIETLSRPKLLDLNHAATLKLQLNEVRKMYGECIDPALMNLITQTDNNSATETGVLPRLVILPREQYPDNKISFVNFVKLMEQQSFGKLSNNDGKINFTNTTSHSTGTQNIIEASISGQSANIARLANVLSSEIKPQAESQLPGRISHELHWQFEPSVEPLRVNWKSDENSWQVNNIYLTSLDKGGAYERNVSKHKKLTQEFRYLLPEFNRSKTISTTISGTATFFISWGDLEFQLDFASDIPRNNLSDTAKKRVTINEWKTYTAQLNSCLLDFEIQLSPVLKLNTADLGLIQPKFQLVQPSKKGQSLKSNLTLNLTTNYKLVEEEIDSINNKIRWKYEFNLSKNIPAEQVNLANYQLNISVPFFITQNNWNYVIPFPLEPQIEP